MARLFDVLQIARSACDARVLADAALEIGIHLGAERRMTIAEKPVVDIPARKPALLPLGQENDSTRWHGERYAAGLRRERRASCASNVGDPSECVCDCHADSFSSTEEEPLAGMRRFLEDDVKLKDATSWSEIIRHVEAAAANEASLASLQRKIVDMLVEYSPDCAWAGFYMLDPDDEKMLVLGPYSGAATPHVRIPVGAGICGAAVAGDETVIVDDVNADPRYLACSLDTKSEIVAPIRLNGRPVGEIDVDSHRLAAFDDTDRDYFDRIAAAVGEFMKRLTE